MNHSSPTPEKIMQISTGAWASAILGAAAEFSIFKHLEGEGDTAVSLGQKIPISTRGLQSLLDGLTGLGLIELKEGRYRNSPEASCYLVEGKPTFMGGFPQIQLKDMTRWAQFPKIVKTGVPSDENTADLPENEYWEWLVPAIATLSLPLAQSAAERPPSLRPKKRAPRIRHTRARRLGRMVAEWRRTFAVHHAFAGPHADHRLAQPRLPFA
jgi:hypothetical protein